MVGRVEISEILGMAATCAVLLFAGFSVETMGVDPGPAGAFAAGVRAPEIPALLELPAEIRLEQPDLERPVHPAPPDVSRFDVPEGSAPRCAPGSKRHASS